MKKIRGIVHKYGDNINTDVIIPARYLNVSAPAELALHCMEDIDSGFITSVQPGDIIVACANFGCGSSREHAPLAIKAAGIGCVIAQSFARIFYRNSLNIGLPILECKDAPANIRDGDILEVDLATGAIADLSNNLRFKSSLFPKFMLELIEAGGLIEYTKRKIATGRSK